jgi:uncharacterized protein DUF2846
MTRRTLSFLLALCFAALAPGCKHSNLASPEQDAQARLLRSSPEKAVIYLLRDRGAYYVTDVQVGLDDQIMGTTWPNTFYRWEVPPGKHVIVSFTTPPAVLKLTTEAGGVYYVWQDINFGKLREPSRLEIVDAITARLTLDQSRLLPNQPPTPAQSASQ